MAADNPWANDNPFANNVGGAAQHPRPAASSLPRCGAPARCCWVTAAPHINAQGWQAAQVPPAPCWLRGRPTRRAPAGAAAGFCCRLPPLLALTRALNSAHRHSIHTSLQVNGTVPAAGGAWGSNSGAWGGDAYSAPAAAEAPTASSGGGAGGKPGSKREADLNRREVRDLLLLLQGLAWLGALVWVAAEGRCACSAWCGKEAAVAGTWIVGTTCGQT